MVKIKLQHQFAIRCVELVVLKGDVCILVTTGNSLLVSTLRSMWETTVMHKQVSGWAVNFGQNFPESPFLELTTRKPPPPFWKTSDLEWPKFTQEYPPPPPFQKTSDLGWPKFTPEYPPPISENFRFGMTKVYSGMSPSPPFQKASDLGWPKFTPEYPPPPILENFRFGMTKVYSRIPPPPFQKASDLGWPKFTPEYPPPHFRKLQIWDDQSLLRNTPPPISESFRFGMTKVYSGIPPPPISGNFRFGMTKVYSRIPPLHFGKLQIWDGQSLLRNTPPNENCQRVQVPDFQNTESYYMWRLYPTRITTS